MEKNTNMFFNRFGIATSFVLDALKQWSNNCIDAGVNIIVNINVTNNKTKRDVKFIKEFNSISTNYEKWNKYLLSKFMKISI